MAVLYVNNKVLPDWYVITGKHKSATKCGW